MENENRPEEIKPFELNEQHFDVPIAQGRFVHFLRKPQPEESIAYDEGLTIEIPIAKDGSRQLGGNDEKALENDVDFYEKIKRDEAKGYNGGTVPKLHKQQAVQNFFNRTVFVDDDQDIFGDIVYVTEIIGDVDSPAAVILHGIKQPEEKVLVKLKASLNNSRLMPDKRQRQKLVTKSTIRKAMAFYREQLGDMKGAVLNGEKFSAENRDSFINAVDPLIQQSIVTTYLNEVLGGLSD